MNKCNLTRSYFFTPVLGWKLPCSLKKVLGSKSSGSKPSASSQTSFSWFWLPYKTQQGNCEKRFRGFPPTLITKLMTSVSTGHNVLGGWLSGGRHASFSVPHSAPPLFFSRPHSAFSGVPFGHAPSSFHIFWIRHVALCRSSPDLWWPWWKKKDGSQSYRVNCPLSEIQILCDLTPWIATSCFERDFFYTQASESLN